MGQNKAPKYGTSHIRLSIEHHIQKYTGWRKNEVKKGAPCKKRKQVNDRREEKALFRCIEQIIT